MNGMGRWNVHVLGFLFLGISGCATSDTIRGEGYGFLPYLRAVNPSINGTSALEFDVSAGRGNDTQVVEAGSNIQYENVKFTGPTSVDLDFDLLTAALYRRIKFYERSFFQAHFMIGGSLQQVRLTASSQNLHAFGMNTSGGLLIRAGLNFELFNWLDLHLQSRLAPGVGSRTPALIRTDLMVFMRISSHSRLIVGWNRWRYRESKGANQGIIDLRLSGPSAGIEWTW